MSRALTQIDADYSKVGHKLTDLYVRVVEDLPYGPTDDPADEVGRSGRASLEAVYSDIQTHVKLEN